jgi:sec-independent protein translocase protein TatC|tara:strand:- start:736 stop:1587 length:852 start_codon:yes stop_codon:yes gene_type:complete
MSEDYDLNKEHEHNQLSFLEHLEVLRWILMRIVMVVFVLGIIVFIYRDFVMTEIIFASQRMDFPTYGWFCDVSMVLNSFFPDYINKDAMCFTPIDPYFLPGKMTGKFATAMLVGLIGGGIIGFPYIIWEFWRFLSPALYPNEKKSAKGMVFFSSLLFILGILFGYYVINPLSVHFLIDFNMGFDKVVEQYQLSSFMGIVASTTLATGVMFELPIVVYFLSRAGLITPDFMRKYRKHAFIITLLVSAIITPPDVFSQILVTIPIVILYEISIYISKAVNKNKYQ